MTEGAIGGGPVTTGPAGGRRVPAIHPPAARVQRGVVAAFDARLGFGEVTVTSGPQADSRVFFHAAAIADGSRVIRVGARVAFLVVPGHLGGREATGLVALESREDDQGSDDQGSDE